ncbi:alkyl hydroperoxide reductase subunit F [Sutterella sp.]|uniref:alkyl hydroperoxide reductase subunit F n=1 Tax=Sutterella sp. TaxID=1981025 RepID=UPI0026DFA475|nr:alkyl hydroperoxide reductase subunit F [Sutterella sp.]MDO5530723.1 alkyl hydroperoxide reductase subunit F [Sutterella sp.]
MLDAATLQQVKSYLDRLIEPITLTMAPDGSNESGQITSLLKDIASVSGKVSLATEDAAAQVRRPSFTVSRTGQKMGVRFAALPMGHEFSSFILAMLQASGYPAKEEADLLERVRGLDGDFRFEVYMSLSCHNCPDVVQALNLMAILNPRVSVDVIDGALFPAEVKERRIMAVPTVYLNGEPFFSGRHELGEIVAKLDADFVKAQAAKLSKKAPFDVLVIGAGPAGATAAIYTARKGLRTGIVCERPGGQVNETSSIENFTSILLTDGVALGNRFMEHVNHYGVDVMALERVVKLEKSGDFWEAELSSGARLQTKAVIVCSGARWRALGVPGEKEYQGHGVAYCPHCDGPLFKGKDVVVVGGGNSGVEAAIDLAALCRSVTLLQRGGKLTADEVLVKKLESTSNARIVYNLDVERLEGDGSMLTGVTYRERATGELKTVSAAGCFVQIGLVPNTDFLKGTVELTKWGEIVTDAHGAASASGIFAGGDCTTSPYKQVVIALGGGATAALGAFDWLIRQEA